MPRSLNSPHKSPPGRREPNCNRPVLLDERGHYFDYDDMPCSIGATADPRVPYSACWDCNPPRPILPDSVRRNGVPIDVQAFLAMLTTAGVIEVDELGVPVLRGGDSILERFMRQLDRDFVEAGELAIGRVLVADDGPVLVQTHRFEASFRRGRWRRGNIFTRAERGAMKPPADEAERLALFAIARAALGAPRPADCLV